MDVHPYNECMSATITAYPGAQSVSRALAVLKSFSDAQPEWQPNELAEAIGLNISTTYRLLATLEREGLLTRRSDTRSYRLGPEMIALGGCALRSNNLRSVARPILQDLAQNTGEAATLEVLAGGRVIVVDETSGQHVVGMSQDVGTRLPAHATSTGKVLLAFAHADSLGAALSAPLEAITDQTVTNVSVLMKQLAEIRQRGYAVTSGELEDNFVAIAAPVFNYENDAIAALSVGGPNTRFSSHRVKAIVPELTGAARQISADLGYRPE